MKSNKLQTKLNELNVLQHRMGLIDNQKRQINFSISELKSSINEVKSSKGKVYSMIGSVIVEKEKKIILKDLTKQESELNSHQKIIAEQEEKFKKKASELQKVISAELKNGNSE
jgi:prefoldin beta subunit